MANPVKFIICQRLNIYNDSSNFRFFGCLEAWRSDNSNAGGAISGRTERFLLFKRRSGTESYMPNQLAIRICPVSDTGTIRFFMLFFTNPDVGFLTPSIILVVIFSDSA
jgi:hypothetical protein